MALEGFGGLCFEDPSAGAAPRTCEACGRMAEPAGGQSDLDGRWSCRKCVLKLELLGWRPRAAAAPEEVTDCLTVTRSQLGLKILLGRCKELERRGVFPDGWPPGGLEFYLKT